MHPDEIYDVVVVGAGPAGTTAAMMPHRAVHPFYWLTGKKT